MTASLRYEFCWDFARALSGVGAAVKLDDDGPLFEVTFTAGTYGHTSVSGIVSTYTDFATALQTAINAAKGGAGSYTVTYSALTGYTISYSAGNFDLTFSTTTVPQRGTNMRHILGMTDRSGASSYSSLLRPYFVLFPVVPGRSEVSDDYEPESIVQESIADGGQTYEVAVTNVAKRIDWIDVGDQDIPPTAYTSFGTGTPVHKRFDTTSVPWSYEDAYEHHRTAFDPILVVDGGTNENIVCKLRADKSSFKPKRMGSADFDLWSVPFGVHLLGRQ